MTVLQINQLRYLFFSIVFYYRYFDFDFYLALEAAQQDFRSKHFLKPEQRFIMALAMSSNATSKLVPALVPVDNVTHSGADPDAGSGAFLPPGSGIRIQNEFFPDPGSF
jgi:hypothetical protein